MKRIEINKTINTFWDKVKIIIYENDRVIEEIKCEYFKADPDWVYVYEVVGGSGTGFKPGEMIRKIYAKDSEIIVKKVTEEF